jgi:hypothetical protein
MGGDEMEEQWNNSKNKSVFIIFSTQKKPQNMCIVRYNAEETLSWGRLPIDLIPQRHKDLLSYISLSNLRADKCSRVVLLNIF